MSLGFAQRLEEVRRIVFDPDLTSVLKAGVIREGSDITGVSKDEALGYFGDALTDIRRLFDETVT